MVKKLAKFFAYTLFFILALIAFMPKESLYFLLEENLQKFGVVLSNEQLEESFFSLNIENMEISAKGIDSALVEEADITLLLVYNSVDVKNIKLSSLVESYLPSKIDTLHIRYTLINPFEVEAQSHGGFGDATIHFNIVDRNVSVILKPSKKMFQKYRNSLREFKKSQNGEYVYAKTF